MRGCLSILGMSIGLGLLLGCPEDQARRIDAGTDPDSEIEDDTSDDAADDSVDAGSDDDSSDNEPLEPVPERQSNATCFAFDDQVGFSHRPLLDDTSFQFLVDLEAIPGAPDEYYILEQSGLIHRLDLLTQESVVALDISSTVSQDISEGGLLSLALAPDFVFTGRAYISYTRGRLEMVSVVSEIFVDLETYAFRSESEQIILEVDQPYANHNGGDLLFDGDGYLYISLGDGGSAGDPDDNGQNLSSLLGTILRIDPDCREGSQPSSSVGYCIPQDNPFVGDDSARPEIYAYGLRNAWRMSYDLYSNQITAADVGQDEMEEVNIIVSGGNYGWPEKEGSLCYRPNCGAGLVLEDPIYTYDHAQEDVSITGGVIYRGVDIPELENHYIFADALSGRVWGFDIAHPPEVGEAQLLFPGFANITHIGQSHTGEVILVGYVPGQLFQLERTDVEGRMAPLFLSETGCFAADGDGLNPIPAAIPYDINHPFYSDDLQKSRFLVLPDGETASLKATGRVDMPMNTVAIKTFAEGDRKLETRLFYRREDGSFGGQTYAWNLEQTDAIRVDEAFEFTRGDGTVWRVPSSASCLRCHSEAAGSFLGFHQDQLQREISQSGFAPGHPQLEAFEGAGIIEMTQPREAPLIHRDASIDDSNRGVAVRDYLSVNCATCHQPGGLGRGTLDLRRETILSDSHLCGQSELEPNIKYLNHSLPEESALLRRIQTLDEEDRMPPIGRHRVDAKWTEVIRDWIADDPCETLE